MQPTTKRCEHPRHGAPCGHQATWLVRVGTRRADEQLACRPHLSATCEALTRAEGRRRRHVALTVLWVAA
jgi:hypothetical protein